MFDAGRLRSLLDGRLENHPMPREFYVDQEVYEADLEMIFYREWIFAGHTFELDRPGKYLTLQVGLYPVVVVRGADGEIRAFHNVCRHRGMRICSEEKGTAAKLVCPYHQWTYELDGRLLFAGDMGEGFDPSRYGLKPVACGTVESYIFVSLADDPPDFGSFREAVKPYLAPHDLDRAKVAYEASIIEEGNWKVVFENNRECFHCNGNHPELMRSFVENRTVAGLEASGDDGGVAEHWSRCEEAGIPSALRMGDDGQFRMTRIPLKEGTQSYTMSGRPAVSRPLGRGGETDLGVLLLFHYPSTWNHVLGDHALSFRLLPLGPSRSLVTTKWIVDKDAVEGRDYMLDDLTKVWTMTNEQDRRLVEETAVGLASPVFEPGPFSGSTEAGPRQFVDWYCRFMAQGLKQR
ncbi:aromatic ring-hydroxylating dioxygenase subunit alpha [Arhodomonas aquaeolei]|uniref:aromatic ring-hydroxylating oxygenase subunit alpha n=1 Tax=Arhodomonas aquaeolei TaxID=2369 RepID=UPI00216AB263|nr:aromatic ring-hydroxylating dioxygenase subunit alpha [Arhodomonas aquaeolei]MCS4503795.1 aromatic ring-hydroxylating dioxygenase subunit alpha [Arhodomonas aquaeolei]